MATKEKKGPQWIETEVLVTGIGGQRTKPAEKIAGINGLCIARILDLKNVATWRVTHVGTGLGIGDFTSRAKARRLMLLIAPLADWAAPPEQLKALYAKGLKQKIEQCEKQIERSRSS